MNRLSDAPQFTRESSAIRQADSFASVSTKQTNRNGKARSKAEEAAILSQASSQAMIAARSILLSGGTHETALLTAKAAALSVLLPSEAEASRSGNKFLARRRAKQQADIIASMSIVSAMNSPPQQIQQQMQQQDHQSTHQSVNNGYAQGQGNQWDIGSMYVMGPPDAPQPNRAPVALTTQSHHFVDRDVPRNQNHHFVDRDVPNEVGRGSTGAEKSIAVEDTAEAGIGAGISLDKHTGTRSFSDYFRKKTSRSLEDQAESSGQVTGTLPEKLPKSRNLAEAIPEEDPIYTHPHPGKGGTSTIRPRNASRSFSTNGDTMYTDGTDDWNTVGSTTVGTTVLSPDFRIGFFDGGVDPFLATITSVFNCGPQAPPPRNLQHLRSKGMQLNEDNREGKDAKREEPPQTSKRESTIETPKAKTRKPVVKTQRVAPHQRQYSAASSVDSSTLLKELDLSSDDEEEHRKTRGRNPAPRESMENIVLRALATPSQSPSQANDRMSQLREERRDEVFSGLHQNPSSSRSAFMESPSVKSTSTNGMKKSSRFRKWATRRKAGGVHNIHPLDE